MSNIKFGLVVAGFIALILWLSLYIVHERELVIKFKLGEIVTTVNEPGLYWKIPLINNIRKFDSRVLTLDTPSERFLTSEKKNVIVDSFVKWRIINPRDYYASTQGDERIAVSRIVSILNDEMKGQFGSKTVREVISGERSAIMEAVNNAIIHGNENDPGKRVLVRCYTHDELGMVQEFMVTEAGTEVGPPSANGTSLRPFFDVV